jgi:hypothetical protein
MRDVLISAALGGAMLLAGAAGAQAWDGSSGLGLSVGVVADYDGGSRYEGSRYEGRRHEGRSFDGERRYEGSREGYGDRGAWRGGEGERHGRWHDRPGYDGYERGRYRGPRYGFYDPRPRPRCWVRPTYWGPERVCRW